MSNILIFAGTTEGRELSQCLADSGVAHGLCVATEYGEIVLKENPLVKVHQGRMDSGKIRRFCQKEGYTVVIDATHPYASLVTENIQKAVDRTDISYYRLKRETDQTEGIDGIREFETVEACIAALEKTEGNILLTTGSKELVKFCTSPGLRERLFVRVLPGMESIRLCMEQNISGRQILAMQGPFTTEMNEAIIHQYQINLMVTKASGRAGGWQEKVEAAGRAQIPLYVIGAPREKEGKSFAEICCILETLCQKRIRREPALNILLAGVGMGSKEGLTGEVSMAIKGADILLGAERMIEPYHPCREKRPFYRKEEILPYLKEVQKEFLGKTGQVVILFSGDSGFYSGCQKLLVALQNEIRQGTLDAALRVMPGISSVSYLAACLQESYQETEIYSIHGKKRENLAERLCCQEKTFLLLSGVEDIQFLGKALLEAGLSQCRIYVGYQLSYPNQQIKCLSASECLEQKAEGLYTCLIKNPCPKKRRLTPFRADQEFIRDRVPMTKEEVRQVSICKLRLEEASVVYDIGSGTGSIAVEIGGLSQSLRVFAIERKKEALSLIVQNRERFGIGNVEVVEAEAPEGLEELPSPTHAFLGGSGGKLKEILAYLYTRNPHMRIVINAVSLETIGELKEALSLYPVVQEEIVQLQASRVQKAGEYHLMRAENPVWICAFTFDGS